MNAGGGGGGGRSDIPPSVSIPGGAHDQQAIVTACTTLTIDILSVPAHNYDAAKACSKNSNTLVSSPLLRISPCCSLSCVGKEFI